MYERKKKIASRFRQNHFLCSSINQWTQYESDYFRISQHISQLVFQFFFSFFFLLPWICFIFRNCAAQFALNSNGIQFEYIWYRSWWEFVCIWVKMIQHFCGMGKCHILAQLSFLDSHESNKKKFFFGQFSSLKMIVCEFTKN